MATLKILIGAGSGTPPATADVDNDGRIGLPEELIYILQHEAGRR